MRADDFNGAWAIADRDLDRLRRKGHGKHAGPRHRQRIWRGEPFDGRRILVRCYHGLGDTIQFARFLPALARRGRELTVWCQPELLPLLERLDSNVGFIPLHDGSPGVDFDVDLEIMEIAHAIRADRARIALKGPYIALPPRTAAEQRAAPPIRNSRSDQMIAVGLVWEAGDWDRMRSVPFELLERLRMDGVMLYSLQRGEAAQHAAAIGAADLSTPDIAELGRRMSDLDIIICVDTMVAHLAGALWRETWIMLRTDCDWRWPIAGTRSCWYPTARIFRQPAPRAWREVVEEIRVALAHRVWELRHGFQSGKPSV